MHSTAYLLLQKEFRQFKENQHYGITALPLDENMMNWDVCLEGLLGTPWQGLFFYLTLNFPPEYNLVPPVVTFKVQPFHPNVHPVTHRPCIDFLDSLKKWREGYTLSSILLSLQVMLSEPVLDNPVNLDAAKMLILDPYTYMLINHRIFKETVLSTIKGLKPDITKDMDAPVKLTKRISFHDYYKTWCTIATSKVNDRHRTPLLEDPNFIGMYYKWKAAEQEHSKEWTLNYVFCHLDGNTGLLKSSLPHYLSVPTESSDSRAQSQRPLWRIDEGDLPSEEVDHLLSWAETLDEAALEED